VACGRSTTDIVREGHGLASRPRPLAAVFRPEFGPAFVRPDCLARFCGLLHLRLRCGWDRDLCSSHLPRSRFHPAPAQPAVLLARSALRSRLSARWNNSSRASRIGVCRANSLIFSAIARKTSSPPCCSSPSGMLGVRKCLRERSSYCLRKERYGRNDAILSGRPI